MGQYGITGWSGGARVPLTYNLKSGQMRGMGRCYIFPNNTYVNNNFYGANYDYGCNCNSNKTPGWMNWMMGIGLGGSLLGGILGMFAKKDDSAEGAGGSEKTTETSKETTKELTKQEQARKTLDSLGLTKKEGYEVFADEDGNVIYRYTDPNDPKNTREAKNLAELLNIGKNTTPKTEVKPENSDKAETLPKLFTNMDSFKKTEDVLKEFKRATGADATKIDDISGNITLSQVEDQGNSTKMSGNLSINAETLKDIEPGTTKPIGTFKGKKVIAENLDGYIRIKVGDSQTYIVGKTSDGKYQGYQFENGNVTGYNAANWTRRS